MAKNLKVLNDNIDKDLDFLKKNLSGDEKRDLAIKIDISTGTLYNYLNRKVYNLFLCDSIIKYGKEIISTRV